MKKRDRTGESTLADFKAYHKATVIKTAYYRHNRHKDQQNSIESLEINSRICGQMISDKDAKTIVGKIKSFQHMMLGKVGMHIDQN